MPTAPAGADFSILAKDMDAQHKWLPVKNLKGLDFLPGNPKLALEEGEVGKAGIGNLNTKP